MSALAADVPAGLPAELLALARPIATHVAARLEEALTRDEVLITAKSTPTDLVTELDTWAEAHIIERILAARPDDGIQGEEGGVATGTSGVRWSIDPIDGTVNFVHGIPGFCVSIAALVDDGTGNGPALAGVVASPLHREVFCATAGGGATLDDRPIRCATPPSVPRSVVATGFGYDPERRRRQAQVVTQVIPHIADIRRGGSAALDLCWVACGRLDGYWEVGLNPWDHDAGALIAAEAGARVAGFDGAPASHRFLLAAPPSTFDDLAALLRSAGADAV